MQLKKLLTTLLLTLICCTTIGAQEVNGTLDEPDKPVVTANIIDTLRNYVDADGNAMIRLDIDDRIIELINREKRTGFTIKKQPSKTMVYRVQVYSSNDQQRAKQEAQDIERRMIAAFPNISTYVSYVPPFWKVRLGDCRTPEEAQGLRNSVIRAFPSLKGDTYCVTDYMYK